MVNPFSETAAGEKSLRRVQERFSMSAEEMKEFLAAMELARQANTAFSDVAGYSFDEDDDLDGGVADSFETPTIH